MYFSMMSVIHLILLCQFVSVIEAVGTNSLRENLTLIEPTGSRHGCTAEQPDPSLPPDHVKITITDDGDVISNMNLKITKRVLANQHLPVWISRGIVDIDSLDDEDGHDLERDYEVMEQLGEFTTYHEPETSSAAIYFHKRREFDGMNGYEFVIHKLPILYICHTETTSIQLDEFGIYRRPEYLGNINEEEEEDSNAGVNTQGNMRTYENHVYDGYPEVLVIVSWDVVKYLTRRVAEADHYTTIVSHVLTTFNGIDMLYSKLKKTKVQINLAGIIIGIEKESFYFLDQCYYSVKKNSKEKLGGRCVYSRFGRYLNARRKKIPIQSYDMALFLTREKLVLESNEDLNDAGTSTFTPIDGISGRISNLYERRKDDVDSTLVGIITTKGYLGNYPTIAHEMAHLMTVNHDKPSSCKMEGKCCRSLMKTSGQWCDQCLSWSATSEKTFKLFFSSPNCCTFINEPRSLYPPGRKQMLTADEQCQCYGYKSMKTYLTIPDSFCFVDLKCKTLDDEVEDTVIPMDGTPCGKDKVCRQTQCDEIQTAEQSDQQNVM